MIKQAVLNVLNEIAFNSNAFNFSFEHNHINSEQDTLTVEFNKEFDSAYSVKFYRELVSLQKQLIEALECKQELKKVLHNSKARYLTLCEDLDLEHGLYSGSTQMIVYGNHDIETAEDKNICDFLASDFVLETGKNFKLEVDLMYNACGNDYYKSEDHLSYVHFDMSNEEIVVLVISGLISAIACLLMSIDGSLSVNNNANDEFDVIR
jgi:hypothetical protein